MLEKVYTLLLILLIFTQKYISLVLEREGAREKHPYGREAGIGCISFTPRPGLGTEGQGLNSQSHLGMRPDRESNRQPFDYRMTLQPPKPHRPGRESSEFLLLYNFGCFVVPMAIEVLTNC